MTQRRSKYNARPTTIDGIRFDSRAEARRYEELVLLEKAGKIDEIDVHPHYELQAAFTDQWGRKHRAIHYIADFEYTELVAPDYIVTVVEDVKGFRTAVFRIKEKLFRKRYSHIDLRILEV